MCRHFKDDLPKKIIHGTPVTLANGCCERGYLAALEDNEWNFDTLAKALYWGDAPYPTSIGLREEYAVMFECATCGTLFWAHASDENDNW